MSAPFTHDQLERRWRDAPLAAMPRGRWVGRHLGWLATRGARHPLWRPLSTVMFRWTRFGIDFDRAVWWFMRPDRAGGQFTTSVGPSRWRDDARVVRLDYGGAGLPAPIRGLLYDELKPLSASHVIGLGGINRDRGAGDHFWMDFRPLPR